MKMDISIKEIKLLMMTSIGSDYCNQVLNIALNDEEHRLALVLSVYYKVHITHHSIYRALCTKNIHFIKLVFTSPIFKKEQDKLKSSELLGANYKTKLDISLKTLLSMMLTFRQECID